MLVERKAEDQKQRGDGKNADPKTGQPEGGRVGGVRDAAGGQTEGRGSGQEAGRWPGPAWRECRHVALRTSEAPRPDGSTGNVYFGLSNVQQPARRRTDPRSCYDATHPHRRSAGRVQRHQDHGPAERGPRESPGHKRTHVHKRAFLGEGAGRAEMILPAPRRRAREPPAVHGFAVFFARMNRQLQKRLFDLVGVPSAISHSLALELA